jgi:CO/xanthine dehydrogenase Mo-binding subunit
VNQQPSDVFGQRFVGQRLARKEDSRLLTGRGVFVDDVALPGMLQVAYHRSPITRGRIVSIDLATAKALPGVVAVFTAEDLEVVPLEMVRTDKQGPGSSLEGITSAKSLPALSRRYRADYPRQCSPQTTRLGSVLWRKKWERWSKGWLD